MEFKWLADGLIELAIPVVWAKPYNRAQTKLSVCTLSNPGDNGLGRKFNTRHVYQCIGEALPTVLPNFYRALHGFL